MRHAVQFLFALAVGVLAESPAYAADSIVLPEPGTLTMLSLGVAGLLIGRSASRKRPRD